MAMSKKERSMMSMECLLTSRRVMRTMDSMETKEDFLISKDLEIFGEDRIRVKVDSRVFLETLRIFLVGKSKRSPIDQFEERI